MPTVSQAPQQIRLSDGRVLAFDEHGDPRGFPVLWCHGGLSCRLDVAHADSAARAAGVRLLAPDRPGLGGSTHQDGRRLLDWPEDVRALTDALGIARFSVLGWSAGGPYALACAYALPGRVAAAGVIAGVVSAESRAAWREMDLPDRLLAALATHAPSVAALAFGLVARLGPARVEWVFRRLLIPADRAALARRDPTHQAPATSSPLALADTAPPALAGPDTRQASLGLAYCEALRPGARGMVAEYRVLAAPWGFAPEAVPGAVRLWYGALDHLCPRSHGEELAARLPRARLEILRGLGHLVMHARAEDVLRSALA